MSILLAVAQRELAAATRRESLHWSRVAVAALGAGATATAWLAAAAGLLPMPRLGRMIFDVSALLTGALALVVGAVLTAGSISRERRDGTLPLLRLAGADGFRLLAGKLLGAVLPALALLLGLQPFVALGFLMGGVAGGEWLRALLAAAAGLAFSASVGLACSAFARRPPAALGAALLLSAGLGLAWPLAGQALGRLPSPGAGGGMPAGPVAAPFVATLAALNPQLPGAPAAFRQAMAGMLAGSGAALLGAWWALRRERFTAAGFDARRPDRPRAAAPEGFPAVPVARPGSGRGSGMGTLVVTLVSGLVAWQAFAAGPVHLALSLGVLAAAHLGLKLFVAAEAVRLAAEARTGGALEVFCTIPAGEVWLRRSWQVHLWRLSLGSVAGLVAVDLALLGRGLLQAGGGHAPVPWLAVTLALLVLLPADVWTLSLVGLREGLRARSPAQGIYRTLGRVLGLPLPFFLGNVAVAVVLAAALDLPVPAVVVACWVIWSLVVNVGLAARAWLALTDGLRHEARDADWRGR